MHKNSEEPLKKSTFDKRKQVLTMRRKFYISIYRKSILALILPLFILFFLNILHSEDIQCVWTGVERIVAVGDIHGDYDNFIKILKHPDIKIIDEHLHWIAGKTHLVQIGDVMDRGDKAKDIFDLIMDLEKQAEEAGGKVHMLIGNHEELNIGDRAFDRPGDISVEQLRSFLPEKFREKREKKIRKKSGRNPPDETESNSPLDPNIETYWEKKLSDAVGVDNHPVRRQYITAFNEGYAKWILKHNAVIKINDIVFVHAGISEKFSTWPLKLKQINDVLREELEIWRIAVLRLKYPSFDLQIAYQQDGPLFYRGFSRPKEEEEAFKPTVERILKNLNAKSMVTAHTPQRIKMPERMKKYDGLIWIIDTTISRAYQRGILSALIIEDFGKTFIPWGIEREKEDNSNDDNNKFQNTISSKYFTEIIQRFTYINRIITRILYPFLLRG